MPRDATPMSDVRMTAGKSVDHASIAKGFDDATAVAHVNIAVAAGEFRMLLAPSGSGNTTMHPEPRSPRQLR